MKKIIFIAIPLLALVILLGSNILKADETAAKKQELPKKVQVQTVKSVDFQEQIFAVGQLASSEEAKLSFKTGGIVRKVYVTDGQKVKKGQLLAELQLEEIEAQVQQSVLGIQQSTINIDNARLMLKKAERDYRNTLALYKDSVATLEQLEDVELQLNNSKNQLQAAETGLSFSQRTADIAQFNKDHSRIVAPADGEILRKLAEPNELLGPGQPVFLFGSREKAPVIRVNVTDKEIIHLELGATASIHFDAYPQQQFEGVVQEIASMSDPYTGTYSVEIGVQSAGKKLLSGFVGQVYIKAGKEQSMLRIPIDALVSAEKNQGIVFTVEGNKAIKKTVDIYRIDRKDLLLNGGLDASSVVVVKGAGYLEDQNVVNVED